MKLKNAVIVDGARSPFSRGGRGKFEATRMDEVAAKVVRTLMERNQKIKPHMIEDVGIGNSNGHRDLTMLGVINRLAGLPNETASFTSNRQCGSSMETAQRLAASIMIGATECAIAMGVERSGKALLQGILEGKGDGLTRVTRMNPQAFVNNKMQRDMAPDHDLLFSVPIPEAILDASPLQPMPQTAQNVVDMYGLTRKELDAFTVNSHRKTWEAYEAGIYKNEVIPMEVEDPVFNENNEWVEEKRGPMVLFERDECLRPSTSLESLAQLQPIKGLKSFCGNEVHVTAGNSCPTNCGASALILMSEEMAIALGLEPLARIIGMGVAGVKGQIMGMGPVPSTHRALKHAGLSADQIERVEFNEAFAAQVIPSLKELGISETITNVNGGSLPIGHPIGATGARLLLTLAFELRRSKKKYGLATQCMGSGMGISTILEAMD